MAPEENERKKMISEEMRKAISERMKGNKYCLGHKHSEETRRKISEAQKGKTRYPLSIETKLKLSIAGKNKIFSAEHRRSISMGQIGKKHSLERCRKNSIAQKGKKLSEECKRKMSESRMGRQCLKETRLKIGIRNKGKTVTAETRQKIRIARRKQITPIKDTKIEIKIQDFLKLLGIDFFTHQYIQIEHGYQCDILVPALNLIIECDGDYWHNYPIGKEIDHIRTKELIEKDFKVLRLWENEINKIDVEEFKNNIASLTG